MPASTISGGPVTGRTRLGFTRKILIALAFAAAVVAILLLTVRHAHGQLASAPWPMFHHDLAHMGLSQFDTSANPGTKKRAFATGTLAEPSPSSP